MYFDEGPNALYYCPLRALFCWAVYCLRNHKATFQACHNAHSYPLHMSVGLQSKVQVQTAFIHQNVRKMQPEKLLGTRSGQNPDGSSGPFECTSVGLQVYEQR